MTTALRVENVSKQYRIYATPGDRLRESLTRGRWKRHREFWALQDISFEAERGTTTGIIGPNGSGKSTLLQIITGTLDPTHGDVFYEGRVAALLELGAGFNPEFTGIENAFMNAALMGFSRKQTEALMPEIERFAEIGPFIHQPVKTYSSGMYVRLAFSVAVASDPEILIVDEALAVGDAVFQHRCLRRIKEIQEKGTTILFVSHDPAAIRALCSRAILLNGGLKVAEGKPVDVINQYRKLIMSQTAAFEATESFERQDEAADGLWAEDLRAPLKPTYRHGDRSAEVLSVELLNANSQRVDLVESGEPLLVNIRVLFHEDRETPVCGFLIRNRYGVHVYGTNTNVQQMYLGPVRRGEVIEVTFSFNGWLGPDLFSVSVAVHSEDNIAFDWLDGVLFFRVVGSILADGVANLNATVTHRRIAVRSKDSSREQPIAPTMMISTLNS
jgi:ABC-type polysaccharide/polyol phosphate transport system ATPase subunit